jgi:membrane protein implicated in regulation of membrane protease activity
MQLNNKKQLVYMTITPIFAAGVVEGVFQSMQFLVFTALAVCALLALGIAAFFGGDHGPDVHHDVDHGDAPSLLSPRSFFAFMLGFCATGAIATVYGANVVISCVIGFVPGVIMSMLAWLLAYLLHKQQANSSLKSGQVVGCVGIVAVTIPANGRGEVDVSVNHQTVQYAATATSSESIPSGTRIKVVLDLGSTVVVERAIAAAA